jgi:hypothetical protein
MPSCARPPSVTAGAQPRAAARHWHGRPRCTAQRAFVRAAAVSTPPVDANAVVNELLSVIKDTDAGASATDAQRKRVQELATQAEAAFAYAGADARTDPRLFGDYRVSYTSSPQAAGGRFRSSLGRALFQTHSLYQNVVAPDVVANRVEFRLFGRVPGSISLRGPFRPCDPLRVLPRSDVVQGEGVAGLGDAGVRTFGGSVEVAFEAPRLEVAGEAVALGGASSVRLATTYLDDRIRIGRGGFGSLFIFERMAPGQQQAEALSFPDNLRLAGVALCRCAVGIFALLSLVVDAIRLAKRAVTTPPVLASSIAMTAALSGALGWLLSLSPVPPTALASAHLLAVATWLGATVWVSFAQGDVLFRLIQRATFTQLRAELRPRLLYAGAFCGALALATAPSSLLRYAVLAHAANLLVAEPSGARLSSFRSKFELDVGIGKEVGVPPNESLLTPTIRRLNQRIASWRAVSASLSIVSLAALAAHLAALGARLA